MVAPALRVAIGIFLPLLTLLLIRRMDLAIFASLAAFTGIYGRGQRHRKRLFIQVRAGSLMLTVMLLATLFARATQAMNLSDAASTWLHVAATTVVAGVCSLITAWWWLRPAGSLFHIFAFAAIASVPHQPPLWEAVVVALLTAALSLLIGISARVVPGRRSPWVMRPPAPLTPEEKRVAVLEAGGYLLRDRALDTVIGASVGIAVVVAPAVWRRFRAPTNTTVQ